MIGKVPKIEVTKELSYMNDIGLDIGTMNIVAARQNQNNQINTASLRNVFLPVDKQSLGGFNFKDISHAVIDNNLYILSEDAYNFANIFSKEVSRPMSKGMISSNELDAVDVLMVMVKSLIGTAENKDTSKCVYSVPANPIDTNMNVIYHQNVFNRIVSELGFVTEHLNEAVAIVYSECAETNFSGIAISFGAGMTNVAVVYKSVPVITFSVARGGDWIDDNAANSTGFISNRVNLIKERQFDLTDFNNGNKKERRVKEALVYYYRSLISYVVKILLQELNTLTTDLPERLPMIISGGTSLATGFVSFFTECLSDYEFPISISDVKHADNPLTAVAEGCLIKAMQ
jgi:actin-like ATPase involved in cell morphogenesis